MDTDRIDRVLQYALLVAGDEDDARDRQLGPIHLIKYVYLADLAFVYNTAPMRNATPAERLDFSRAARWEQPAAADDAPSLTVKQKKKLKASMDALRAKLEEKKEADGRRQASRPPRRAPRYDDVYFAGLEWLDSLAGEEVPTGEMSAVFTDNIWKSPARTDDDFP